MTWGLLRSLVLDELRAVAPQLIRSWLRPSSRLAWAVYWREVRIARRHPVRAAFWAARVEALTEECDALQHDGCNATDIARKAARLALRMEGIVSDGC